VELVPTYDEETASERQIAPLGFAEPRGGRGDVQVLQVLFLA
jgi:hypothetical protein